MEVNHAGLKSLWHTIRFKFYSFKTMKKENKTPKPELDEIQDWDLTEDFGIFPRDISLTQNIGCVGNKKKEQAPKVKKD